MWFTFYFSISLRSPGALLCPFIVTGFMKFSIIWNQNLVYWGNWSDLISLIKYLHAERKINWVGRTNATNKLHTKDCFLFISFSLEKVLIKGRNFFLRNSVIYNGYFVIRYSYTWFITFFANNNLLSQINDLK